VSSQLLHTCSLAEYEKLEIVLDSLATTENISVTNIILVLKPKDSSLLGGKLTQDRMRCQNQAKGALFLQEFAPF